MAESRQDLIRWCATADSDNLEQMSSAEPCFVCGQPTRTFSLSFHVAAHLRCSVRFWELHDAEERYREAQAAVDRLRGHAPPPRDGLPF